MIRLAVIASGALLATSVSLMDVRAQRVQFPPQTPTTTAAPSTIPPGSPVPSAYLGGTIQPFDPYALPSNMGPVLGPVPYAGPSGWPGPAPAPLPGATLPALPPLGAEMAPSLPPLGQPYGAPLPGSALPPAPPTPSPYYNGSPLATPASGPPYQRLFQGTGLTVTYLHGSEKDDLALTDVGAQTTAHFPNFLGIPSGLRVTPAFIFHWTDGPKPPENTHVPGRLYSTYLDFAISPSWSEYFATELNASVGIYSDFQSVSDDSIRFLGSAVGIWQSNPATALKLGVTYLDRLNVKLLPVFGVLWTPNTKTKWDITFPSPKLSNYWTTVGNKQVWWYLGGEYGGGSWTIEREGPPQAGAEDRMDINDIRIFVGVECSNLNRMSSFAEIGYVFDREVLFHVVPSDSLHVDDTFMLRGGVSW